MGVAKFKEIFKPGDWVEGYSTNMRYKITAIGEQRMLIIQEGQKKENVAMIDHQQAYWRKPKEGITNTLHDEEVHDSSRSYSQFSEEIE